MMKHMYEVGVHSYYLAVKYTKHYIAQRFDSFKFMPLSCGDVSDL